MSEVNQLKFKVINASAGSGKTYTLVKEYLTLLFKNTENYKHILAITFTNKATAEMKERIISALKDIAENDTNSNVVKNMLPEILAQNLDLDSAKIQEIAGDCLSKILHNYSDFSVSTIDSFSHKIIRAFSHDMELSAGFSIELKFDKLVDEAVSNLIARAGNDEQLTEFLINYIDHLHETKSNQAFEYPLKDLGNVLANDKIRVMLEKDDFLSLDIPFFNNVIQKLFVRINSLEKNIKDIAETANDAIKNAGLTEDDFIGKTRGGIGSFFNKAPNSLEATSISKTIIKSIENYDDNDNWIRKDLKKDTGKCDAIISIKPVLYESCIKLQELFKELADYRIIMQNIYAFALLNEIAKEIDLIKTEQNILPIAEFNSKISNIVAQSEAPYIYERIGEKYKYFMIDEFQDTSILQWQNVLPLIDNSLANNYQNLIVGDGKQAIYIWRNGEVRQFTSLPKIFQPISNEEITRSREDSFKRNINDITLNKNFRSAKTIVEFNNSFFKFFSENNSWIKDEAYTNIYDYSSFRQIPNSESLGYVEIDTFVSEKGNNEEYKRFNIEKTYEIITKLHDEYNYNYGDIAVMSYTGAQGQLIGNYLLEKGINVVSPDSLSLFSSNKVLFICSIINMLTRQSNEVDLNICLKYLCETNNREAEFESLSKPVGENTPHIQAFAQICKSFNIDFETNKLSLYSGYELCEYLIDLFKLNNKDIFIQRFLNIFQENQSLTIAEFPEWLEENKKDANVSSIKSTDAVQIMSIHKSKGLEFPIVICAFTDYKISSNKSTFLYVENKTDFKPLKSHVVKYKSDLENSSYQEEYFEERESQYLDKINLLYVAFTRAREQLYILTKKQKPSDSFSIDKIICSFLDSDECNSLEPQKIDDTTTTFGKINMQNEKDTPEKEFFNLESIYHDWRSRIKIATPNKAFYDPEDSSKYTSEQIRWGNKFHNVISTVKIVDDIKNIDNKIDKIESFDEKEKTLFIDIFNSIIENKEIYSLLFDYDKAYFEKEMFSSEGKIYRADRITIKNGIYNIIDFKTGEENVKDIKQINNYCKILNDMGIKEVRGFIVYCKEEVKLVKV